MRLVSSAVILLAVVACGEPGAMEVEDAWGRTSPASANNAAFYVTVHNATSTEQRLVGASSDRCEMVQIHLSEVDDQGVMRMRPADAVVRTIAPGERMSMEPGGLHVMCMGVSAPLVIGEMIPLTLTFESGVAVDLDVVVEDR